MIMHENGHEVSGLVERLLDISQSDDHARGCQGRQYTCSCGFDDRAFATADEAASLIQSQAARIAELEAGLRIIAGETQCIDNLMGNADIARALLNGESKG